MAADAGLTGIDSAAPPAPGSLYLAGLLAKQQGLNAAKDKLLARAAQADEDDYIAVQIEVIHAEYLKISALTAAYLQQRSVVRTITPDGLRSIRSTVEQLHAVQAERERAHDIVLLVSRLLNEWDGSPAAQT